LSERLVVLDTNVVLDMLHFDDPHARPLRHALESGRLRGAATPASFDEWQRVLAYPAFALDAVRQAEGAERYRAACIFFETSSIVGVPRCADADDQKFLDLAAALGVPLVSKDRAVLTLRRRCAPLFPIMTPAAAVDWLATG
jgi:predicted nucleic acid-binding protein